MLSFQFNGKCNGNYESFYDHQIHIPNEYKKIIKNSINNDLYKFPKENFNPTVLGQFYQNNLRTTAIIDIDDNGDYTMTYSKELKNTENLKNLTTMMKNLHKKYPKLPKCFFVVSFEDQQLTNFIPIFQNSVFKNSNGIMYPLWYYFSVDKIKSVIENSILWTNKESKAIWRGSSTGLSKNDYRKGRKTSRKYIVDTSMKFPELIDAKFTNLVQDSGKRLRDNYKNRYKEHESIPPREQIKYKYILSSDGNGGTYGLYWTLASGSCVLNNTEYRQWFSPFFKQDKHFIVFNDDENNENLKDIILYLKNNDKKAMELAKNSRNTSKIVFNEHFVLEYMYQLLEEYNKIQNEK